MPQVNTTRIGRKWELYAHIHLFPGAKLMTNVNRNAPYDLLDGEARINVKAGKLKLKKHGKYFDFLIKRNDNCDYFLLVGYNRQRDKNPLKVWLVPACLIADRYRVTIGQNHHGQWKEFEREVM